MEYLPTSYDFVLVVGSILIALAASFTSLELINRVASETGFNLIWISTSAISMGGGIWAMHFVGMLAFSLPIPYEYDVLTTGASLLVAIAGSLFAIIISSRSRGNFILLIVSGAILGISIFSMHFVGMMAMRMEAQMIYNNALLVTSFATAIVAATSALWFAEEIQSSHEEFQFSYKISATVVMSMAIAGMHYIGMAAVDYLPLDDSVSAEITLNAIEAGDNRWLAIAVSLMTLFILGMSNITLFFDNKLTNAQAKNLNLEKNSINYLHTKSNEEKSEADIDQSNDQLLDFTLIQCENNLLKSSLDHISGKFCIVYADSLTYKYCNRPLREELNINLRELESISLLNLFSQYSFKTLDTLLHPVRDGVEQELRLETCLASDSSQRNAVMARVQYAYHDGHGYYIVFICDH